MPAPEWRQGPTRYLLTRDEDRAYKGLKTDAERRRFIETFWKRRDPTPETPHNEFRDDFWRRVQAANDLFNDTAREGWITDRGKIYILLGPPDDMLNEQVARSHRGIILWMYRTTWAKDIGPNVVIAFARDVTGEFRISTSPSTDADVFRGLAPNTPAHLMGPAGAAEARAAALNAGRTDPYLVAQGVPSGLSQLSLLADLGRLQQAEHLVLSEYVSAQALFGEVPIIASSEYYKANDGSTYTAITVFVRTRSLQYQDLGGIQIPHVGVYARLEDPETGDLRISFEAEDAFVPSPDNGRAGINDYLLFQAGAGMPPGRYRTRVTVHDRVAQRVGRYVLDIEVPDYRGGDLTLSSVALAERLEPAEGDPSPELKRPYVFGSLRVIPKPGIAYAQDQKFAFYYQAYHAETDSESGRPLLDVQYRFARREADGALVPWGRAIELPSQMQAAQGFAFPLADWPIGSYRLTVHVTDRLTGRTAERSADFVVR